MNSNLKTFWHNITVGGQRALLWARALAMACFAALSQWMAATPQDLQRVWTVKEWAGRAALVCLAAIIGLIAHGEKNDVPGPPLSLKVE
jgi:hypothetical protein